MAASTRSFPLPSAPRGQWHRGALSKFVLAAIVLTNGLLAVSNEVALAADPGDDLSWGVDGVVVTEAAAWDAYDSQVVFDAQERVVLAAPLRPEAGDIYTEPTRYLIERHLPSGGLDPTFGVGGRVILDPDGGAQDAWVPALDVLPDGRIVAFLAAYDDPDIRVVRLLGDGTLDTSFGDQGFVDLTTLDAQGCLVDDNSNVMAVNPDGSVYLLGFNPSCLIRLDSGGSLDAGFAGSGVVTFPNSVNTLRSDSAGRALLVDGVGRQVFRVLQDGSYDTSFSPVPLPPVSNSIRTLDFGVSPYDGRIVVTYVSIVSYSVSNNVLQFFRADGTPDPDRLEQVHPADERNNLFVYRYPTFAPGGQLVLHVWLGNRIAGLVALDHVGNVLESFGTDGYWASPSATGVQAVSSTGRIIVPVWRSNPDTQDFSDYLELHGVLPPAGGGVDPERFDVDPERLASPASYMPVIADPVNTASGALVDSEVDLSAPAGAPYLQLARHYDSRRASSTVLGSGWRTNWDAALEFDGDDVVLRDAHGAPFRFTSDGSTGYVRAPEMLAELSPDGVEWHLDWFSGQTWVFDAAGRLSSIQDWAGRTATISRNVDGTIATVVGDTGASMTLTYATHSDGTARLTAAEMSDGRRVDYSFTDDGADVGLLASVDNPASATTFEYSNGRIAREIDTFGSVVHDTEYDNDGRVVRQTLPTGEVTQFAYDDVARTTTVTDVGSGDVVVYEFGPDAKLISITDPGGNQTFTSWNSDGQLINSVDRLGHAPAATYDTNGNLTSVTDPVRGTTTYVYDSSNRVVSVTEPTGATTTLDYEGLERLPSSVTDGLGHTTLFDVVDGLVVSVTDPDGVSVAYGYDAQRRMVSTTNGLGDVWTYGYDAVGRRTSETTPLGHVTSRTFDDAGRVVSSTAADGGETTYSYDGEGRVLSVTDPVGAVTSNTYDPVTGLLASTTDPVGRVTSYTYDALGQLTAVTNNDGAVSETDYGTLGRVTATRDALDREVTYAYDANGNRTEVNAPDGGVSRTEYDTAGRITALEDPLGRRTSHTYDEFGRLVTVTQPDGTTMSYTYDLLGRRVTVTAPDGGVTSTGFTPAGRTDSVTDAEGGVTSYGYDLVGRLESVTDPNLHTTTIGYDADGRRTAVTTPEGLVTSWEYDPVGRITKIIDPAGVSMTRTYTLRGEVETEQRSGDGQVAYVYNLDGTLGSVTDAVGNTTSFTYDAAGRRATRIDATGAIETWGYNPAGELVAQIDRLGNQTTVGYDANGRIESVVDASGRSTSHTYNTAGELLTRAFGDGTTVDYTYDAMGRRASMVDATGTTTYAYDAAGRPTEIASPSGTLGYGYDLAGRRTSLTYPDGTAATYTYDPAGRLTAVAEPSVGTVSYALDADGRLTQTGLPNGQTRDFGYTDGRLTTHVDQGRATTLTYDNSGRIATLAGADNHTYTYDAAGQLLEAVQDNGTFAYTYGTRGEITSISDPDRTRSFDHNANVEITTIVDDAGATGGATYDTAGRMVEHVDPDGTITSYGYDARGLLVEVVVTVPAEPGDPGPCAELTPTIVGTDGDDVLTGGNGVDIIFAGDGNDIIDGGNGADIICAGPGNDTIIGGNGADVIDAGPGDDHIDAGQGADTVTGGRGTDTLVGDKGDDVLAGGYGYDTIDGGPGDDICEDDNPTACETLTPTAEPPAPSVTIESRTYDGDGTLTQIDITQPDGTITTDDLLWDPTLAIAQIVTWTDNAGADNMLYGYQREAIGGGVEQYNSLGDTLSVWAEWSPYGQSEIWSEVAFGYRGELATPATVYLRARTLDQSVGVFTATDPLEGLVGTTVLSNAYHYANNDPSNLSDPLGLRATDRTLISDADLEAIVVELRRTSCLPGGIGFAEGGPDYIDCLIEYRSTTGERAQAALQDVGAFALRLGVSLVPFGDCALAGYDQLFGDGADVLDITGCAVDAAGASIAAFVITKNGLEARRLNAPLVASRELPAARVGWSASNDYVSTFRAAHPDAGDVWVHHAVEQQVLNRYPGLFRPEEIHSLENLRGIPSGTVNNQIHLSEIRTMWNTFYRENASPSRQAVLDFATEIDRKLGVFFDPPVL